MISDNSRDLLMHISPDTYRDTESLTATSNLSNSKANKDITSSEDTLAKRQEAAKLN